MDNRKYAPNISNIREIKHRNSYFWQYLVDIANSLKSNDKTYVTTENTDLHVNIDFINVCFILKHGRMLDSVGNKKEVEGDSYNTENPKYGYVFPNSKKSPLFIKDGDLLIASKLHEITDEELHDLHVKTILKQVHDNDKYSELTLQLPVDDFLSIFQ